MVMPLDSDQIEEKIKEHSEKIELIDDKLDDHGEKIEHLQESVAAIEGRLVNLEQGQIELKYLFMNSSNMTQQAYSSQSQETTKLFGIVIDLIKNQNNNKTRLMTNDNTNKSKIYIALISSGLTFILTQIDKIKEFFRG